MSVFAIILVVLAVIAFIAMYVNAAVDHEKTYAKLDQIHLQKK